MVGSPWATQEYGAAAAATNFNALLNPSYCNNHNLTSVPNSANLQDNYIESSCRHEDAELSEFIIGSFDASPPTTLNEIFLSHGSGAWTSSSHPRPSALLPMSSTPAALQQSTICNLQPRVFEHSPSLTFFVAPPPPPSQVVQLHYLPASHADNNKTAGAYNVIPPNYSCNSHSDAHGNADFSFHSNAIDNRHAREAFASDMQALASAMDTHNNQNADALNFVAQAATQLIESPDAGFQSSDHSTFLINVDSCPTSGMSYVNGAFSDSAAMQFSSASAATPSLSYQTSMVDFDRHMSLSAPVSPSPSVNMGPATHESFHNAGQDMSSIHGGNGAASVLKTQFYKLHDKSAWRRHGPAQGGIVKRRKYSRRTSISVPHSHPTSIDGNATHTFTDPEESNSTHEDVRVLIKVKTDKLNLHDGYVWRKYGEKTIKEEKYSRNYLRCDEDKRSACTVLKRTQRCSQDEDYVEFLYLGRHNHPR